MLRSSTSFQPNARYSHIYIEREVAAYPLTRRILARLPGATVIEIERYKQVFNRKKQSFDAQKQSPKLILAKKHPPFLYPLSSRCQPFGNGEVLYTTPILGCPFNCRYCFLRGLYDSANLVVFVNTEDFFEAIQHKMQRDPKAPLSLHLSYESDLLALEELTGLCADWMAFTRTTPGLTAELRTKSAAYSRIRQQEPCDRFIFAWSLSPDKVGKKFEPGAPCLKARLKAVRAAAADGRQVRLCIDPVLPIENETETYLEMIKNIFDTVPVAAIRDVSVGPFRLGDDHLRKMRRSIPEIDLFIDHAGQKTSLIEDIVRALCAHIGREKVFQWPSQS